MSTAPVPPRSRDRISIGIRIVTVLVVLAGIENIWIAFQIPHLKTNFDHLLEWQPGPHRLSYIFRFHYLILTLAFLWPLAALAITRLMRRSGARLTLLWMIFSLSILQTSAVYYSIFTQFSALSGVFEMGKK